jgi:hypothetical protein
VQNLSMTEEIGLRWEGDERGTGVGNARRLLAGALQLTDALSRPAWVAERPEAHLLPNMSAWITAIGTNLELVSTAVGTDGSFEVEVRWLGRPRDLRSVRAQVFGLVGQVAESATYIRQRGSGAADLDDPRDADTVSFEVATGTLDEDTTFASHGHVVLIKVVDVFRGR